MASSVSMARLVEERRQWRKDHPFGFWAKPVQKTDGSLNMYEWECGIPGKAQTDWEGGIFKLKLVFKESYPTVSPQCIFTPPLFHPNVFQSGSVCLSILSHDWKPSINIKTILLGIQELLNNPNPRSPANDEAYMLFRKNPQAYSNKIKEIAKVNKFV